MRVLLIGSGGREHSLARKISESPRLSKLYCAPGNPGTAELCQNVDISATDIDGLLAFAQSEKIDLTVVGPETPLAMGIADRFAAQGLRLLGPNQEAAQLESSKEWAKAFMDRAGIPTAAYRVYTNYAEALDFVQAHADFPIVIKADGLAAGKGVTVAKSLSEAEFALKQCFVDQAFDSAGEKVVIESFLPGEEASVLAFMDGRSIVPMVAAQDHKAVFDGDAGPNTGGMGAYSPAPIVTEAVSKKIKARVFDPLLKTFQDENIDYRGIIYAGLMIHDGDPYVVEFNVRMGDPETQVVLPRLETDLLDVFDAVISGRLNEITLRWKPDAAVCVVMAAPGYPGSYKKGQPISGLSYFEGRSDSFVIQAGTRKEADGTLLANGGRVLGVVGVNPTIEAAVSAAYAGVRHIDFEGSHYRTDIAAKAKPPPIPTQ